MEPFLKTDKGLLGTRFIVRMEMTGEGLWMVEYQAGDEIRRAKAKMADVDAMRGTPPID